MSRPVYYFVGGTTFGIILSMGLASINTTETSADHEINEINKALTTLNTTTENLQNLVQKYTHVLPTITTLSTSSTTNTSDNNSSNPQTDNIITQMQDIQTTDTQPNNIEKNVSYQTNVRPTQDQTDQYNSIETQLYEAANNPNVLLSKLISEADRLTNEQRQTLTEKAMEMIKNGELDVNQFSMDPGT